MSPFSLWVIRFVNIGEYKNDMRLYTLRPKRLFWNFRLQKYFTNFQFVVIEYSYIGLFSFLRYLKSVD